MFKNGGHDELNALGGDEAKKDEGAPVAGGHSLVGVLNQVSRLIDHQVEGSGKEGEVRKPPHYVVRKEDGKLPRRWETSSVKVANQ